MQKWIQHSLFMLFFLINSTSQASLIGYTIGIDPGHGGGDPGAQANGIKESNINLATALALRDYLEADGATVVMTRTNDNSVTSAISGQTELSARARFFNSRGVQYAISVHHNSAAPNANGVLAYIARGDCDPPAKSGTLARSVVVEITRNNGLSLMKGGQSSSTPCSGKPGVFQYNAVIVAETSMPAILSEMSFVTNPQEAERLKNAEYLKSNGWAIYAGLATYLEQSPLPLEQLTTHDNYLEPTLQTPIDGAEMQATTGIQFQWHNNNVNTLIDHVAFTLQEAFDYQSITDAPIYVGQCADLNVGIQENYVVNNCGTLKFNQWYQWRIVVKFKEGTTKSATAYFKTMPAEELAVGFSCKQVTEIPQDECQALVNFYDNTQGDFWWIGNQVYRWKSNATPCQWDGIYCEAGHVTQIKLRSKNVRGHLPNLSNLSELRLLVLDNNRLEGIIPPTDYFPKNLQILSLFNNRFLGDIPDLSGLTQLRLLQLQNNHLCGDIPEYFQQLTELIILDIDNNHLNAVHNNELRNFLNRKNPGWLYTQTPERCPQNLQMPITPPELGTTSAIDSLGNPITTAAKFAGGVVMNSISLKNIVLPTFEPVDIIGYITPDPRHVGQTADILLIAAFKELFSKLEDAPIYLMLDEDNNILLWDREIKSLVPFRQLVLNSSQEIKLYSGYFVNPASLAIDFKYRLQDGTVVSSGESMKVVIIDAQFAHP